MAEISFHPSEAWVFELYGDADNRPGETDRMTWQIFAGYRSEWGRVALLYAAQRRETSATTKIELNLASVYGAVVLGEGYTVFGRVDRLFDPIPDGNTIDYISFDPSAKATFLVLGLDVALNNRVSLIPNIEAVFYDKGVEGPVPGTICLPA